MIYSPQRPIREMLNELGITDHPSPVPYHRALIGPDGESLGLWEASGVCEVLKMENPLGHFRNIAAERKAKES